MKTTCIPTSWKRQCEQLPCYVAATLQVPSSTLIGVVSTPPINSPEIDTERLLALCGTWRRRQVAVRSYLMADGEIETARTREALQQMGVPTTVVECAREAGR